MRRRTKITIGVAVVVAALVTCGTVFPTERMEWDGFVPAREIRFYCVDDSGKPVVDFEVQRRICDMPHRPGKDWHTINGVKLQNGVLRVGIGARGASGGERTYFWGLYKRERRDHPQIEYRIVYKDYPYGSWREDQLLGIAPEAVIPLAESVFGPNLDPIFGSPRGKAQVANMGSVVRRQSAAESLQNEQ